jgi:hypothetical protein
VADSTVDAPAVIPTTVVPTTHALAITTTTEPHEVDPRVGRPAYDDFVLLASLDPEIKYVCDQEYESDMAACHDSYERGTPAFESVIADNLYYYTSQPTYTRDSGSTYTSDTSTLDVYTPGTSCSQFGNTAYCSDGTSYTQFGNTTYGSDGTSYTQFGNTTYGSDGTSYTQFGNTTYGSDGTSYTQFGNTTYGSDGTSCTEFGSTTYCSP